MKVKFGSVVVEGIGKLGGHQFQRGRFTSHLVTKRPGFRGEESHVSEQNRIFRMAVNKYQELQKAVDDEWRRTHSNPIEKINRLGEDVTLSTFNAVVMMNMNRHLAGLPMILDPFSVYSGTFLRFQVSTVTVSLNFSTTSPALIGDVHAAFYYAKYYIAKRGQKIKKGRYMRLFPRDQFYINGDRIRFDLGVIFPVEEHQAGDRLVIRLISITEGGEIFGESDRVITFED